MATFKTAIVPVANLERSVEFCQEVLELAPVRASESFAFFENGLELYDAQAFSRAVFDAPRPTDQPLGRGNLSLYFETDDINATFAAASKAATIVQPITRQPWGQDMFRFTDPDGHLIEVGGAFTPDAP